MLLNPQNGTNSYLSHCVKSVRTRSFSGPYFPAFGLNTKKTPYSLCFQSKCRKMQTRKIPNMGTFHAVPIICLNHFLTVYRHELTKWFVALKLILPIIINIQKLTPLVYSPLKLVTFFENSVALLQSALQRYQVYLFFM